MKINILSIFAVVALAGPASAATYFVTGGTTSVDLDDTLLGTIGWSVTGASGTVAAAPGFDVAFPILPSSTFSYDDVPFAINGGDILHTGTVSLTSDGTSVPAATVEVGDFTITSGLEVVDTFATGVALFTAGNVTADPTPAGTLVVQGDLLVTSALSNVLVGDDSLVGGDAGNFQVNAVPEPGIAALGLLSALMLGTRRRRV